MADADGRVRAPTDEALVAELEAALELARAQLRLLRESLATATGLLDRTSG